ncbi:DMT family transporter [Microvirga brassicacearum]|uniref:DMT family transporter n=1 Tax=Microvirga brassicacearum TaxID=2580413 RepID=A0A5N3PH10_9HYPH|nr:DMT family transporter [Microvirga brassicacearum]KAB0268998.1 DMT family transporter [Microvirga brassicacearum]
MRFVNSLWNGLFGQAFLLLALAMLMWGGNAVAGRLAVGEISPMALTCLRWVMVLIVLLPIVGRQMVAEWSILKTGWRIIVLSGIFGFTAFNALFYTAAHYTTAVNLTLFQGAIPVLVLLASVLFLHVRVARVQVFGMLMTIAGVVLVSVKGDLEILRTLALNIGDVFTLIACVFYAAYTLGLRRKPPVSGLVFFTSLAMVAFMTSLPLLAIEMASGSVQWPTPAGWVIMLYIGLLPSLVAQVFFIRGVELIGPARAGLFVNLVPVFGALLAVLILGEPFALYHAVGLALVLGGIWLAERRA